MVELILGDYLWETYREAEKRVSRLCAGLRSLMEEVPVICGDGFSVPVVLFAETRAEWLYAAEACWRIRRPVATVYPELVDSAFVSVVEQTQVSTLLTEVLCCYKSELLYVDLWLFWLS